VNEHKTLILCVHFVQRTHKLPVVPSVFQVQHIVFLYCNFITAMCLETHIIMEGVLGITEHQN
jgi:hypothetical protein